jgi:hypothetical protein
MLPTEQFLADYRVGLDTIANIIFIAGTIGLCLVAMAALVAVLGRDSENDQ